MENKLMTIEKAESEFELVCKEVGDIHIAENASAAFKVVGIVRSLEEILSKEVMEKVFMPLMNRKIGFLTDRTGISRNGQPPKPLYSLEIVRDSIIDAVSIGLLPTGNQFNIIAERMYPTKEGYTALLKKIGVKYLLSIGLDKSQNQSFAEIPVTINYEWQGEKKSFQITATVKKDSYSSSDQLRGKAERRAKKVLYEYITGCDFGDTDEDSSATIDTKAQVVSSELSKPKQKYTTEAEVQQDVLRGALLPEDAEKIIATLKSEKK